MLESFHYPSFHDFAHTLKVIDLIFLKGFKFVFPIEGRFAFSIHHNRPRCNRELPVCVRVVVTFERDGSFLRWFITELCENTLHGGPANCLFREIFHLIAIGKIHEIRPTES